MRSSRRARWLLGAALLAPACANRTDVLAREAFDSARGQGTTKRGERSEVVSGGGGGVFEREKVGWDRVEAVLGSAVGAMQTSPSDDDLGALAQRWCDAEPQTDDGEHGVVHTCDPQPPIVASGATFLLEMGGGGVIGLVAPDLSAAQSIKVAQRAREAAKALCTEAWTDTDASHGPEGAFMTCPAEGGPLLSVGRFPKNAADERWLVSLAVLSPG